MFYDDDGSAFLIAQENIFNKWKWSINRNTCPARLLNPDRVSKESTATLVIHNVTLADSGTYGCVLVMTTRSPITSKVKLVVTSLPHIILIPSSSIIPINESQQLFIHCSATGTPTPNVRWLATTGDITINQVVRNTTVNITYVTRNDSGMYNCCATNNPNKPPVCKSTLVSVQYKPEIDVLQSTRTLCSYNGGTISLYCLARGVPSPQFKWYDPSNRSITTRSRDVTGGSVLELVTTSPDSYGLYRCKAENILGYDEHFINVSQKVLSIIQFTHGHPYIITTSSPQATTVLGYDTKAKNKGKSTCPDMLYIQGQTFSIVHLVATSISVTGNIIMVLLLCYLRKRACVKGLRKNTKDRRVLEQDTFAMKTDGIEIEPHDPNTPRESPNLIPPNINNGNVGVSKEYAEPAFLVEEKLKDNPAEQHFLSESQCLYQQINDAGLHEYQSLQEEKEGLKPPSNLPGVTPQKHEYATLNYHKQEGSEYQSLDLYSSIQDEK